MKVVNLFFLFMFSVSYVNSTYSQKSGGSYGNVLSLNEMLESPDKSVKLILQTDGNLVITKNGVKK